MLTQTIEGQVENGQLRHTEPLGAFEGQQVSVTVTAATAQPAAPAESPGEEEPPEGLDVERDVYVKVPFQFIVLKDVAVINRGPMQPCLILPAELPDA